MLSLLLLFPCKQRMQCRCVCVCVCAELLRAQFPLLDTSLRVVCSVITTCLSVQPQEACNSSYPFFLPLNNLFVGITNGVLQTKCPRTHEV